MATGVSTFLAFSASLSVLILASSALPVERTSQNTDCSNCTQVVETLLGGLHIFREIADPSKDSRVLKSFLRKRIGNETGATVLCGMLPTDELVPECWRKEQEIFCYQWKLRNLSEEAFRMLNPSGITPNYNHWMNQIADVPNSEGKDYICLNYITSASKRCEQLFLQ